MEKVTVIKNVEGHGKEPQNVATFCTRFPFSKETWDFVKKDVALRENGPEFTAITQMLGVVRAVSYSTDSLYDLHVKKANSYSWEELETEIVGWLVIRHDRLTAELEAKIER